MCGKSQQINNFTIWKCTIVQTLVLPAGIYLSLFLLYQAGFQRNIKTPQNFCFLNFEFLSVENLG